jgi:hypothetical protein
MHLTTSRRLPKTRRRPSTTRRILAKSCRNSSKWQKKLWRNLTFDEEPDIHLLDHFCKRGNSEKDPTKPCKPGLFGLLLKYMVASGALII